MKRTLTGYATICLLAGSLFYTTMPAMAAAPAQSADRAAQEVSRTLSKPKPAEVRQTPVKSSPEVAVAKTPTKDAPGKRFWGRIMNHFREINSAEKKPK